MRALKICERNNGRRFKKVFFRHCDNNTAAGKTALTTKHCKKHCFSVVGLGKRWCLEKGIAEETGN